MSQSTGSQFEPTRKSTWSDTDTVNLVKELAGASNLSESSEGYQAVLKAARHTASFNASFRNLSNHQMRSAVQKAVNIELDKIESARSATSAEGAEGGQASATG
ncbi:hypothetical protein JCM24511_00658 [Saitozyma sp. JCM 24511]|nr:hypothetical protein JCM24511_00658 [Saitozyma sp. JCM 24511]